MRDQLLPRALDCLDHVLRENEGPKAGEWLTKPWQFHMHRGGIHLAYALRYLDAQTDPAAVIGGHDFATHLAHAFVRMGMAVELYERETGARNG